MMQGTISSSRPNTGSHVGSAPDTQSNVGELMERLAHVTQQHLGPSAQTIFFVGDGIQRASTDALGKAADYHTWLPSTVWPLGMDALRESAQFLRLLVSEETRARTIRELQNKADVFSLVKNLSSRLDLPSRRFVPLSELVRRAYSISPFEALWAVEGVGHNYTDTYWHIYGRPNNLLSTIDPAVPMKAQLMLHAGMGIAFADRLLGTLTSDVSGQDIQPVLEQFIALCEANSKPGYFGAAIESLGLVTRDFYPDLLRGVASHFRTIAPDLTGFFWHGAGRALYFSRQYFIPTLTAPWSGLDIDEGNEADRLSAMAGLSWAITLVNMRHPQVMEDVLDSIRHPQLVAGFSNGVASSIIMRSETTPEEPFVEAFYSHQPVVRAGNFGETWENRISRPAISGVQQYYPALKHHNLLDQVFRHQDLAQLAERSL